ncbi:helix-turn-helix domain-containing protein [Streptacidiphilus jiangxiensis]|uniref:AraC-type DNA-binding protein n=1 Tax=Streptacidiphilus jiangxiensis TaxID=235985 RepID=A0A1H7S897_STRJI|nr:AraC family transcriptional regulator [Streptacidiphilus jiangxiensis]SEL68832.1 AraC-type DNA-binding protein [Streptacidiphilus jiangxiensis]
MEQDKDRTAPRGVLHPEQGASRFTVTTAPPGPALAPYVEYHWIVRWDVTGQPPYDSQVLSHPNVHLVLEPVGPLVYGVIRGVYTRRLVDAGQVHGVRFLPGGFRAFASGPVQELTDQVLPADRVFGAAVDDLCPRVLACAETDAMVVLVEEFLTARVPSEPDPQAVQVAAMVREMTGDRTMLRVEQVAARFDLSPRTLQRLFAEYVGVAPKAVLRRARLHEAAQRADAGSLDWAALAADLGYADQAHLTRDFTAVVGVPPSRYARGER